MENKGETNKGENYKPHIGREQIFRWGQSVKRLIQSAGEILETSHWNLDRLVVHGRVNNLRAAWAVPPHGCVVHENHPPRQKKTSLAQSRGDGLRLLEEVWCFAHSSGIFTIPGFQLLAVKRVVLIIAAGKEFSHQGCRVRARNCIFTAKRTHILQQVLASSWKDAVMEMLYCVIPNVRWHMYKNVVVPYLPIFGGTYPSQAISWHITTIVPGLTSQLVKALSMAKLGNRVPIFYINPNCIFPTSITKQMMWTQNVIMGMRAIVRNWLFKNEHPDFFKETPFLIYIYVCIHVHVYIYIYIDRGNAGCSLAVVRSPVGILAICFSYALHMRLAGRSGDSSSFLHNFALSSAFALKGVTAMTNWLGILRATKSCKIIAWHPQSALKPFSDPQHGFSGVVVGQCTDPFLSKRRGSIFFWEVKKKSNLNIFFKYVQWSGSPPVHWSCS